MHGNKIDKLEIQDLWTYLRIASNIADEYSPQAPVSYIPHLALEQEYYLANALYHMTRSVKKNKKKKVFCL